MFQKMYAGFKNHLVIKSTKKMDCYLVTFHSFPFKRVKFIERKETYAMRGNGAKASWGIGDHPWVRWGSSSQTFWSRPDFRWNNRLGWVCWQPWDASAWLYPLAFVSYLSATPPISSDTYYFDVLLGLFLILNPKDLVGKESVFPADNFFLFARLCYLHCIVKPAVL